MNWGYCRHWFFLLVHAGSKAWSFTLVIAFQYSQISFSDGFLSNHLSFRICFGFSRRFITYLCQRFRLFQKVRFSGVVRGWLRISLSGRKTMVVHFKHGRVFWLDGRGRSLLVVLSLLMLRSHFASEGCIWMCYYPESPCCW